MLESSGYWQIWWVKIIQYLKNFLTKDRDKSKQRSYKSEKEGFQYDKFKIIKRKSTISNLYHQWCCKKPYSKWISSTGCLTSYERKVPADLEDLQLEDYWQHWDFNGWQLCPRGTKIAEKYNVPAVLDPQPVMEQENIEKVADDLIKGYYKTGSD